MNPQDLINKAAGELTDEQRDWIERTMLDLREGDGSVSEVEKLQELLLQSPEARKVYLKFNQLNCQLATTTPSILASRKKMAFFPVFQKFRLAHFVSAMVGVGVGIAAVLILMLAMDSSDQEQKLAERANEAELSVASLYSDYRAHFGGSGSINQQAFDQGAVSLERGIAQLSFRNGAQIVLEGKCGFEIIDEMTVILTYGKMWAYCPPEAHGFRVLTPGGREIIDLGTEFGIEVSPEGRTDVHVLEGLVSVVDSESGSQEISEGNAMQWNHGSSENQNKLADYDKFVTPIDLMHARLRAQQAEMLKRDDLLLYYDFTDINSGEILNKAKKPQEASHGKAVDTMRVSGRFGPNSALQFERPGSRVQLKLERPAEVKAFTMALWVNINQLPSAVSTLINSDGWSLGDIHFQVTRNGALSVGLNGGEAYKSPPHSVQLGQWHMMAVTWDLDYQRVELYCDGKKLLTKQRSNGSVTSGSTNLQWGDCQIGSWKVRANSHKGIRDLKGRVDEIMIFDHTLSSQEILELYTSGKP